MDERLMKKCIGKPVPEWDMAHRLSIHRPVGPEVQDFGTTFCISATFMDVTEPSFLDKQWVLAGAALAFLAMGIGPYIYIWIHPCVARSSFLVIRCGLSRVDNNGCIWPDSLEGWSRPNLQPEVSPDPLSPRRTQALWDSRAPIFRQA